MAFRRWDPHKMNSKAQLQRIVYELEEDSLASGEKTKEEVDAIVEEIWTSYTTRLAAMGLVPPEDDEE